jgi:hypothetical protein
MRSGKTGDDLTAISLQPARFSKIHQKFIRISSASHPPL